MATCDKGHGSTIRAEMIAETAMLSPPWWEVACLGTSCLVDGAIGSKLTPYRAEYVTQVSGCALLAAISEPPNGSSAINQLMVHSKMEYAGPLMEIGLGTGSTITDAARIHVQSSYNSTKYDSDQRRIGFCNKALVAYMSMNSGWHNNVNVSRYCSLAPTGAVQPQKRDNKTSLSHPRSCTCVRSHNEHQL